MLAAVDRIEITSLFDNLVDFIASDVGPCKRLKASRADPIVAEPLDGDLQRYFVGGHGLSMLVTISCGEQSWSLLFDAGSSVDGLVFNLERLEIDPEVFDAVVLSHGHWDHIAGLVGLLRAIGRIELPLVLHPDAYLRRAILGADGELGAPYPRLSRGALMSAGFEMLESASPTLLFEDSLLVTGQVPRTNDFETGRPDHYAERQGRWEPDPLILDDQGIVMNLRGQGLVVLSGCAHAGIVNTVHHAQALTGVDRVYAVLGGLHLSSEFFTSRIPAVVGELVALEPVLVATAHCTGVRAAQAIAQVLPSAFVQNTVGSRYTLIGRRGLD